MGNCCRKSRKIPSKQREEYFDNLPNMSQYLHKKFHSDSCLNDVRKLEIRHSLLWHHHNTMHIAVLKEPDTTIEGSNDCGGILCHYPSIPSHDGGSKGDCGNILHELNHVRKLSSEDDIIHSYIDKNLSHTDIILPRDSRISLNSVLPDNVTYPDCAFSQTNEAYPAAILQNETEYNDMCLLNQSAIWNLDDSHSGDNCRELLPEIQNPISYGSRPHSLDSGQETSNSDGDNSIEAGQSLNAPDIPLPFFSSSLIRLGSNGLKIGIPQLLETQIGNSFRLSLLGKPLIDLDLNFKKLHT